MLTRRLSVLLSFLHLPWLTAQDANVLGAIKEQAFTRSDAAEDDERRGDNVTQTLKRIVAATGDQLAVLSSVGLTELVHGIYRAQTLQARSRRDSFIRELLNDVEVYPYSKETAFLAGKIDGE